MVQITGISDKNFSFKTEIEIIKEISNTFSIIGRTSGFLIKW